MPRQITRRDLINGVAVGAAAGAFGYGLHRSQSRRAPEQPERAQPSCTPDDLAPERSPDYYPPARTGLRGDTDGSFDAAHELRKGVPWHRLGEVSCSGEQYDLIVVGAGVSGLAAAHFFRQRVGPTARILILENHDDFGGHATRNEFVVAGRTLLTYGGSQSLANPGSFSAVSKRLMQDLGIDLGVFDQAYDRKLHAKLGTGLFFDRESFGQDRLLTGMYQTPWPELLARAPLSASVRREIARIYTEKRDYLSGKSIEQKVELLKRISYADYLLKYCGLPPEALVLFQAFPLDLFTVGIDAVSAWSCFHGVDDFGAFKYPGFDGLGLPALEPGEPYIYHFPDGNASVARLLVRSLVPAAVPGDSMHDVVLARVDYAALDQPDAPVRMRLNSTVVHVRRVATFRTSGGKTSEGVEVAYFRAGKLRTVLARDCVLAGHNAMIPYLCPDLPQVQRQALSYLVRMPLVYTQVALRNWQPFAKLGIRDIVAPRGYHHYATLDFPVSLGTYRYPSHPDEPAVLFMLRVPCRPGLARRDQNRLGRWDLLTTPFATFERNIRDQLGRMLAGTGFNPDQDICGITVNRWAHGYSFIRNRLFDPEWPDGAEPWVIGRRRWGNVVIANADAGASPYLDTAIDQAWRAVDELLTSTPRT